MGYGLGILGLLTAIVLARFEHGGNSQFAILGLQLVSVVFLVVYIWITLQGKTAKKLTQRINWWWFGGVVLLAVVCRGLFLQDYPYVSLGDEVRDGGLNTYQLMTHNLPNVFGWGAYESHGLIIPALNIPIYMGWGATVYVYRLMAVLVGTADVGLLYLFLAKYWQQRGALVAAVILALMPIHIFYSRTEIVVIWSSFWSTVLWSAMYIWWKHRQRLAAVLLVGLLAGLASNFHASTRTVAVFGCSLVVVYYLGLIGVKMWQRSGVRKVMSLWLFVIVLFLGYGMGYGPRWWTTTPNIFFQQRSFGLLTDKPGGQIKTQTIFRLPEIVNRFKLLANNYWKSIGVIIFEPTASHYPEKGPLLGPILGVFFLIGLISAGRRRVDSSVVKWAAVFCLAIPFLNSAMTEVINNDHRLAPLFPLISFLAAYGLWQVFEEYHQQSMWLVGLAVAALGLQLGVSVTHFFVDRVADSDRKTIDYVSAKTISYLTQVKFQVNSAICLQGNQPTYDYLRLIHVREAYQYFLPKMTFETGLNDKLNDHEIMINRGACSLVRAGRKPVVKIDCGKPHGWFTCPIDYKGQLLVISDGSV